MLKVSNKNTREKCEISSVGIYSEENVWREFHGGETFKDEGLLPRRELFRDKHSGVVIFEGIIQE